MTDEFQDLFDFAKDSTVIIAVVCFAFAMTLASMAGVMGWPLIIVLLPAYAQYMFVILERSALGHKKPPVMGPEVIDPFQLRPILAFLLILFFVWAYAAARELGYLVSSLVVIAAIVILPAMLSILVISGNFLEAFNPGNIFRFIAGMKFAYLRALVALILTGLTIGTIGALHVPEIVIWFLFFYVVILVFRYLGHIIYLQRHELGLAPERAPELDSTQVETLELVDNKRLMDHIFDCSNTGQYDKAYLEVMEYAHRSRDSEKTIAWFIQQSLQWDNKEIGLRLAQWSVSDKLEKKKPNDAWLVFEQAIMANPKFQARNANEAYVLAQYARSLGKKGLALDVLVPFTDENIPQALSSAALKLAVQVSAEDMNDTKEARRLILIARRLGGLDKATEQYFEQIENA